MSFKSIILKIIIKLFKIIRATLLFLFLIIVLIIIYLQSVRLFTFEGIQGRKNIRNGLQIKEGLNIKEVITIMGYPSDVKIDTISGSIETEFSYIVPPNSFSQCRIYFDNKNRVTATQVYDE